MLKGRGIAEGVKGFGVPFSLAIPRNQRIGPNGEKPGNYSKKIYLDQNFFVYSYQHYPVALDIYIFIKIIKLKS